MLYTLDIILIFKILVIIKIIKVKCTIDMNLSEFQYLANHLHIEECRKLVAALHFECFETPNALDQSEKKISRDVPCLDQLLHWNSERGGGKRETHEIVSRRLTQIGREDLAKWLSTKSYEALGHDFERISRDAFKLYEPMRMPNVNLTNAARSGNKMVLINQVTTVKNYMAAANRRVIKQESQPPAAAGDPVSDPTEWTIFDTISWTIVIILFLIVIVLMIYCTMSMPCCQGRKKKGHYECLCENDSYLQTSSPSGRGFMPCSCSRSSRGSNRFGTCPARSVSPRNQASKHRQKSAQTNNEIQPACYNTRGNKARPCSPKSVHMVGSSIASEGILKNKDAYELIGVDMPRGVSKKRGHHIGGQAFRTIDIHQKIAIPMHGHDGVGF